MSIDTGTSLDHYLISSHVKEPLNSSYTDDNGHGTHIAGIILDSACKEVEFISCKYWYKNATELELMGNILYCLKKAELLKVDFINFSSVGQNSYQKEYDLIKRITSIGIKMIVAAGNEGIDISKEKRYPACYNIKGLITIGNLTEENTRNPSSNYGLNDMKWEIGTHVISILPDKKWGFMSGTSQATARYTNKLIKEKCENRIRN